ncbi:MAG: hypothetical protein JWL77_2598, partial [Chthonomonadaceae bacterium]|nr:hypothetical protein [Chthonomonadaceae bacterium]
MGNHFIKPTTRRQMLQQCSAGFGMLALAGLLSEEEARAVGVYKNPLAPKTPM